MDDSDLPNIGAPATRALASAGITRLAQLADRTDDELLNLHGFGPRALAIIRNALADHAPERELRRSADPMAFVIALPIADRRVSFDFYRQALGLDAVGVVANDGIPEPLTLVLAERVQLMLVPTDGFAPVIGDHEVAERGQSECVLDVAGRDHAEVNEIVDRARRAGARVVEEPQTRPWGYAALLADPDGHLWSVTATAEQSVVVR